MPARRPPRPLRFRRPWASAGVRSGPFVRGVLEALLVPLGFVAVGLGWLAALAGGLPAPPERAPYPPLMAAHTEPGAGAAHAQGEVWLVDGFNVVQVALLGGRDRASWWTGPRRFELLARAEAFEPREVPVFVVFDGGRPAAPDAADGRVTPVFAPSADDWMLGRLRSAPDPARVTVVTADRRLAARVRRRGGRVASPAAFLARCPSPAGRGELTAI